MKSGDSFVTPENVTYGPRHHAVLAYLNDQRGTTDMIANANDVSTPAVKPAVEYLYIEGYITSPGDTVYAITDKGREHYENHSGDYEDTL